MHLTTSTPPLSPLMDLTASTAIVSAITQVILRLELDELSFFESLSEKLRLARKLTPGELQRLHFVKLRPDFYLPQPVSKECSTTLSVARRRLRSGRCVEKVQLVHGRYATIISARLSSTDLRSNLPCQPRTYSWPHALGQPGSNHEW